MRDFFRLSGLFVARDAFPFLGWMDLGGYEKAMKRTAKEFDSILEEWLEEHRRKRDTGQVSNTEQDFMDVLLSVLDGTDLPGYDIHTVIKSTAMVILRVYIFFRLLLIFKLLVHVCFAGYYCRGY